MRRRILPIRRRSYCSTAKKDQIIPSEPTKAVVAAFGAAREVSATIHGYHMLLRDLDRETVWKDIDQWIVLRSSGQQNGAAPKPSSPGRNDYSAATGTAPALNG